MNRLLLPLLLAIAIQTPLAAAPQAAPELFLSTTLPVDAATPGDLDSYYLAYEPVRLNKSVIDPSTSDPRSVAITVGASRYTFVMGELESRGPGDFTWFGAIEGEPESQIVLTCYRDAAALFLGLPDGSRYALRYVAGDTHMLCKVNPGLRFRCGTTQEPAPRPPTVSDASTRGIVTVRVLMVWPPVVRDLLGGENAAVAAAQGDLDLMNIALENSEVDVRVQLAHGQTIDIDQASTYSVMLQTLTDDSTARDLRNQYEADLVGMLTSEIEAQGLNTIVGLADLPMGSIDDCNHINRCFSVTNYVSANTDRALAHELAHNLGCGHGYGSGTGQYSYSHGYRFEIAGTLYRTIMAYDDTGFFRIQVPHFSNPNVSFTGPGSQTHATGNGDHDNARTIRENGTWIAGYRNRDTVQYVSQGEFGARSGRESCPWETVTDGLNWLESGQEGTLYVGPGHYNEPMTIQRPLILRLGPYDGDETVIGVP